MQRVQMFCEGDGGERDQDSGGDNPEGGQQAAKAEAVGCHFFAAQDRGDGDPGEGEPVEDALRGVGRPDCSEDEAVADAELEQVAGAGSEAHRF